MRTPIAEKLAELRRATDRIIEDLAPRKGFTPAQRKAVALKTDGHCAGCDEPLMPGWQIDHRLPLALGGAHELSNFQPLCGPSQNGCHVGKTRHDIRRIAAARRIRKREEQGPKPSKLRSAGKLEGRGFDKTKTRTFAGAVVARKERA